MLAYNRGYRGKIKLVILDMAGTVCDGNQNLRHRWPEDDLMGCKAPLLPFHEVFKQHGVTLDWASIRQGMGMYKPDHLRLLMERPEVRGQFTARYGRELNNEDYQLWLDEFKTLLATYALDDDLSRPVDGALEAIEKMRQAEILVGADTGYFDGITRALHAKLAAEHGLHFDVSSNSEVAHGRPSPCMIYDCMTKAKIWPSDAVVKVDDTVAGMLSGNSAGCWTVGLYASGNHNRAKLATAKPDYLIPSIKYLPELIFTVIEPRLRAGERPGQGII